MLVKASSFSDFSDHDSSRNHSSLLSLIDSDSDNQEIPYDELRRQVSRIRTDHSTGKDISYPELHSHTVDEWASKFESDLQVRSIPHSQWSNAAIIFLTGSGEVNMAMRECRHRRVQLGVLEWPWDEFKAELYDALCMFRIQSSVLVSLNISFQFTVKIGLSFFPLIPEENGSKF